METNVGVVKTIFVNIVEFQMYSLECDLNVTPNRKSKFTLEVMAQPKNVMPLTLTYTDKTILPKSFLKSEGDLSMFHGENILPKLPTFKMDFITLILMQSASEEATLTSVSLLRPHLSPADNQPATSEPCHLLEQAYRDERA